MPTVLVTGCQGKVGRHVAAAFKAHGWKVVGIDLARGIYDAPKENDPFPETYIQCDLADAGAVFSTVARFKPDAVCHVAAIPDPTHNPPHTVFQVNTMSTFNVVEACVRLGVPRLVYTSSEQVPGFFASERVVPGSGLPAYCPVDEEHPIAPQVRALLLACFDVAAYTCLRRRLIRTGCCRNDASNKTLERL